MKSPLGKLKLISNDKGLSAILWENDNIDRLNLEPNIKDPKHKILQQTVTELREYFNGDRTSFSIPMAPVGTEFQIKVWNELKKIPYGETISYGELAKRINNPKASRAVGAANGKNPIPIVVPCHQSHRILW